MQNFFGADVVEHLAKIRKRALHLQTAQNALRAIASK